MWGQNPWGRETPWGRKTRGGAKPRGGATCDARNTAFPRVGATPVGAPLVTPGTPRSPVWREPRGGATCDARCRRHNTPAHNGKTAAPGNPPHRETRPPSGRHECRPYVGGPWETPVWGKPRGGATCDARCRRHNTPAAPGTPSQREPAIGQFPATAIPPHRASPQRASPPPGTPACNGKKCLTLNEQYD